jgi:hypothetical protein
MDIYCDHSSNQEGQLGPYLIVSICNGIGAVLGDAVGRLEHLLGGSIVGDEENLLDSSLVNESINDVGIFGLEAVQHRAKRGVTASATGNIVRSLKMYTIPSISEALMRQIPTFC